MNVSRYGVLIHMKRKMILYIYIVTTLFGIAGGLNTTLQFIVPRLVKFVMFFNKRRCTKVNSEVSTVQT